MPDPDSTTGQITANAAEFYDANLVPSLFGPVAEAVCGAAALEDGQLVLDVACGTGALTRAAEACVAPRGRVFGLDRNPAMLTVARHRSPGATFAEGTAEALPFPDLQFDATLCQFGLMFFDDPSMALAEMVRVTREQGRIAVAVWAGLDVTPGYAILADLFDKAFGPEAAGSLGIPFGSGDPDALRTLAQSVGLDAVEINDLPSTARFASVADFVTTEVRGWTLSDRVTDAELAGLIAAADSALAPHTDSSGQLSFPCPARLLLATTP